MYLQKEIPVNFKEKTHFILSGQSMVKWILACF